MRIDGKSGLDPQGLQPASGKNPRTGKAEAAKGRPAQGPDAIVESVHQPLVEMAMAQDEVNVSAVEEARRLLNTGQLDSPEAVRVAAERILDFGL